MTPNNIVNMALLLGVDIIALSDHNTCKNLPAIFNIAEKNGLLIIPAVEACTAEEVHVLCYFNTLSDALAFDNEIYKYLPDFQNDEENFGNQFIMDNQDNIIGKEEKLLINALSIDIEKLQNIVNSYGGIAVPAHVDKSSNSIISNLGLIPKEYNFSCVETKNINAQVDFDGIYITNSDAHYLEHINEPINFIDVKEKSISAVINYLKNI